MDPARLKETATDADEVPSLTGAYRLRIEIVGACFMFGIVVTRGNAISPVFQKTYPL